MEVTSGIEQAVAELSREEHTFVLECLKPRRSTEEKAKSYGVAPSTISIRTTFPAGTWPSWVTTSFDFPDRRWPLTSTLPVAWPNPRSCTAARITKPGTCSSISSALRGA